MPTDQAIDLKDQTMLARIAEVDELNGISEERVQRERIIALILSGVDCVEEPLRNPKRYSKMAARRKIRREAERKKVTEMAALATVGNCGETASLIRVRCRRKTSRLNRGTRRGRWSRRDHKPSTRPSRLALAA